MADNIPSYSGDLFTDAVLLDPHEHYRTLRELGPVVWLETHQMYAFPRYEQVRSASADPGTYLSGHGVGLNDFVNTSGAGSTLMSDGERHTRQRSLLFGPLTPRALVPIRGRVQEMADELVEQLVQRGSFDAVADLARALPLSIVPDLVGWPKSVRGELLTWAAAAFDALGPLNERVQAAAPLVGEMMQTAGRLAAEEDLLPDSVATRLLQAVRDGEINPEEMPVLLVDYLVPSLDTTISAIGSAVWLLANHPEQWQALRDDPSLVPRAFNEVIRFESPIRCFARVTSRETDVEGHRLPSGARIVLLYSSANRDERVWDRPDQFDIRRDNVEAHLGFGYGEHNCAGQGLARIETQAILSALVARVDHIEVDGARRGLNNLINAFTTIPVSVTPATSRKPEVATGSTSTANPPSSCPVDHQNTGTTA